jgi:hypothetical protein
MNQSDHQVQTTQPDLVVLQVSLLLVPPQRASCLVRVAPRLPVSADLIYLPAGLFFPVPCR